NLGPITVRVLDANGTPTNSDKTTQVQLYIDHNPGGARFIDSAGKPVSGPLTATMDKGVATFADVRLDKAGVGYTLGVQPLNTPLLPQSTSNAFVVSAAQADHLAFVNQPTYTGTTVGALHLRLLDRSPAGDEHMGWVNALVGRALTEEQV